MGLFDEQIDRFDANMKDRIDQLSGVFDDKIAKLRELLKGITITNSVNVTEVRPPEPK